MTSYPPKPENVRAPANLSQEEVRRSLEELDGKIKILQGRAHATASDSNHTYHEHIATLEKKRALIAGKLTETSGEDDVNSSTWSDIKSGIESLTNDIKKIWG